jgi:mono/diheme cytochrome c family protein
MKLCDIMFRRLRLCALVTMMPLSGGLAVGESGSLANASFELPARGEGEEAARGQIEAWGLAAAGVLSNDGSAGGQLEGAGGEQVAYLSAAAGSRIWQDLRVGATADSDHVFRVNVGLRPDAAPGPGASIALKIQNIGEDGRPLANLAIETLIIGREDLSTLSLRPFEVSFRAPAIAPPGMLRVVVETVAAGDGQWVLDDAEWEVSGVVKPLEVEVVTNDTPQTFRYGDHISPILTENCFACHGPDPETREARLRLDVRGDAITPNRRGRTAIVPGDAEASTVFQRMIATDEDEIMPPPESHKTLSKEQIEMIRVWIEEGAVYERHWSYEPIASPAVPEVSQPDWVIQPLDAFVLEKMEANGLSPAPEADKRTLARRVALDLTGVPPSLEMLQEFLDDEAPGAYERYVDRLLALPKWGEHRARYWLDVARYADTHGIHFDNYREIWGYRDWVIGAFNRNLPFDQFTIEQLAGDLMPQPSEQQLIATGFNRCNITTNEGGVIEEEYRVLYSIDRTDAMATAWLGLTASCAACHDHKFDPVSAKEFYSLAAFFNNSTVPVMDGNIKNPGPTVMLLEGEDRERWDALEKEIPAAEQALASFVGEARGRFEARMDEDEAALFRDNLSAEGLSYHAPLDAWPALAHGVSGEVGAKAGQAAEVVEGPAGSAALKLAEPGLELPDAPVFELDQAFSIGLWVRLDQVGQTGSLVARLDDRRGFRGFDFWIQGGQIATHLVHSWADDAIKVVADGRLENERWHHLALTYDGSAKAAGVRLYIDGVEQRVRVEADTLRSTIKTDVPLRIGRREVRDAVNGMAVKSFRLYSRVIDRAEVSALAGEGLLRQILAKPAGERDDGEKQRLFEAYLARHEGQVHGDSIDLVARLKAESAQIRERTPSTHVFREADTLPVSYVLNRGEYAERRDLVPANTPAALPPMSGDLPRNRLGLAKWLVSDEQPLTARVTVNRFWLELFGEGLVTTPGDFGLSGQKPSHPELLDWLAHEFRAGGWDVKAFYRMLVTSATYRQAAVFDAGRLEKDPANVWLSRGPRFRMDGEMIRDTALFASGLLVPKIGGPSVKPYQPDGVWEAVAMFESNTRNYQRDNGESLYRRGLYTFWKRSAPPASLEVFNAPNREVCTVQRERGNTPLQALAALNDPQLVEAARHLAQRAILAYPGESQADQRLHFMALPLISRPLRDEELGVLRDSVAEMREHYGAQPADAEALLKVGVSPFDQAIPAAELAAWTLVANQMMNLDEVLVK